MAKVRSIDKILIEEIKKGASLKRVKYIVGLGADVNTKNQLNYNGLCYCDNAEVAEFLIDKGIDVNLVGYNGHTPLYFANKLGVVDLLIKNNADVNAKDCYGISVLMRAIRDRNYAKAMMLIKANADIHAVNYGNMSVLHFAVDADAYDICKYLLENGCDVNAVDNKNRSLWWDVKSDKMARLLIDYGIKLDGKDTFDTPDLFSIVYNRRIGVMREFIDAGADINVTNQKLENALFITTQRDFNERQRNDVNYDENKNRNVVKLLIDGGIDIKQKNLRGEDALGVATVEMRSFILDYIERRRNNPELFEFVKSRSICKD